MGKLTHYADKAIEYLFYILFFFVPLVLWPGTSEVFEFNKMLLVYVLTILIAAAWIVKWIDQKKITIRRTPLDIPILLFLLSQILSTVFSIDTHTSLWGYYSRFHGGLMSTLSYTVLFYALVSNFKDITFLIYSIISSAVLVSVYGILEHLGIDKNLWVQDVQNRVFSTLGQPNWLSAYLVAILPLPIFYAIKTKNKNHLILWISIVVLFLTTILFTRSQSGLGATAIVLAAIALYLVGTKFKYVYLLVIPLILALVVFKWSFFQKISPLGPPDLDQLVRQNNLTRVGGSDSLLIRQVVWQGARELAKKNPLFGTGVETFGYAYFNVRPATHNLLSEWEFLYNKAHNEYLNMLSNSGFFGLGAYLILNVALLFLLWPGPFFFGLLGIMITNYFGFSVVPVALFFFLFPAMWLIKTHPNKRYLSINLHINQTLGLIIVLLMAFYFLRVPYRQFTADLAYNTGKQYLGVNALKPSLEYSTKATQISPNEALFWSQLAQVQAMGAASVKDQLNSAAGASLSADVKQKGTDLMTELMTQADANSAKAVAMNPVHTNFYKDRAKTQLYLGTIDPKYNAAALQTLLQLLTLAPTDAKVAYNIALLYQSFGQDDLAKIYFQKAITLKPDYDAAKAALKGLPK